MKRHEFHNALRILRSIDRYELEQKGVIMNDNTWQAFRDYPFNQFIQMPELWAEAVWEIIEERQR